MVAVPMLLFLRASGCGPCNHTMTFWDKILTKISNEPLLKDDLEIVIIEGKIGLPIDVDFKIYGKYHELKKLPKSISKVNVQYPTFIMIKQELWDLSIDNENVDITQDCEVLGFKFNENGLLVPDPDCQYGNTFPFSSKVDKGKRIKGLYEWILDTYVNVQIGKVPQFDELEVVELFEEDVENIEEEDEAENSTFYIES